MSDKDNPDNFSIQLAYKLLTNPQFQMDTATQEKYKNLSLRIVQLLMYWYFPQGNAESDDDEEQ